MNTQGSIVRDVAGRLAVYAALAGCVCAGVASSSISMAASWNIEIVDDTGYVNAEYNSLAIDNAGKPHIAYHWESSSPYDYNTNHVEKVRYAVRDAATWHIETVFSSSWALGDSISLALDGLDNPHVCYDREGRKLVYAFKQGSTWKEDTVSSYTSGRHNSLALDSTGRPSISYWNDGSYDLLYARWDGSAWRAGTVDSTGQVGYYTSLALDASDNPRISYCDATNHDLKYAAWDGNAWQIEAVDSTGYVGSDTSLTLDASGNPHISYYDQTNQDLKYAAWDGNAWQIETVDSTGDVGRYTSLALDASGNPHISYIDDSGTPSYTDVDKNRLKYAFWDGSTWHTESVDGAVGYETSLALDDSGNVHISYRGFLDPGYGVKYAYTPEPATLGLLAAGVGAVWMKRRRKA